MTEEVDKIKLSADTDEIDKAIDKLDELQESMEKIDGKPVKPGIVDGAKESDREVEKATKKINKNLKKTDEKTKLTAEGIAKSGKDIKDVFKSATLTILGTAAAIGLASSRLNDMKGNAISAGISVQGTQVGGGVFETAGVGGEGYTGAISQLRDLKAKFALGEGVDPEFIRRLAIIGGMSGTGLDADDIKQLTPEQLADAIINAAEIAAKRSPGDLDVIRENVQVLLGDEFARVFDYNQALGRSWEDLKKEFQKYAFISEESTKQNSELTKEFQKSYTLLSSFTGEFVGSFAENFKDPLTDINESLIANKDEIKRFVDAIFGGTRAAYDVSRETTTDALVRIDEAFGDDSTIADKFLLPQNFIQDMISNLGIVDFLKESLPEKGLLEKTSDAIYTKEKFNLDTVILSSLKDLSFMPEAGIQSMEKISNKIENNAASNVSNNSNTNGMIINGPLLTIEGNASKGDIDNGVDKTEKMLRNLIVPSSGVRPDA